MIDKENKITMLMYESLKNKYLSEMKSAEASLMVYFTYSVGIGEHPQHLEEMDKFIAQLAEAEDKLETLQALKLIDPSTPF